MEGNTEIAAHIVMPKTGEERLRFDGQSVGMTLLDYWRWSASDLLSNAARGMFAEFIVATALGLANRNRIEWQPYDLQLPDGTRIEVKSAAYLQTWKQKKLSSITFGIRPTQSPDDYSGYTSTERRRQADVYIFCLLSHTNKETVDPLCLDHWEFYVVSAVALDKYFPTQKTLSLSSLLRLQPNAAKYDALAKSISEIA